MNKTTDQTGGYSESDARDAQRTLRPIRSEGIGRRISVLADRIGTRRNAAQAAGISADSLQRYIREENMPPFDVAARLCFAAGARMDWLATEEGEVVVENPSAAARSQPGRLEPDTIASALKLLTWAFDLQGAVYDPGRDPDLLAETYVFLVEHGGSMTPDNLVDFSKRLAAKREKEATGAIKQGMGGFVPGQGDY